MKTILTLTLVTKDNKILLGLKKRGFGMGRLNGFGGKIEQGETIIEGAIREIFEETSLEARSVKPVAILNFSWQDKNQNLEIHLFHCDDFIGEARESEEMKPDWYNIDNIPYKKMWDDDKYWLPLFLQGKKFKAAFIFDKRDKVVKYKISIETP